MKSLIGSLIAACLFVAQAAPSAQGATITRDDHYPFYGPGLVQYVAAKGTFPAVVIANPFGAGRDGALLSALELPGYLPPTALSPTSARDRDDGHLVLIFDPVSSSSGHAACAAPDQQSVSGGGGGTETLRLQIAFCYDDEVVSEAFMEMPRPRGPGDPDFNQAMAQLLYVLLPPQNPNRGACQNQIAGNC